MNTDSSASSSSSHTRGRGRGKSRGGLGKYLRARGRGHRGGGRPAEFRQRLVLEDEELVEIDPESEDAKENQKKYSKRQLASNADRYKEPEPVLNSDGEVDVEPEVDLSSFLARQTLDEADSVSLALGKTELSDDEDVDTSLEKLMSKPSSSSRTGIRKGNVQQIEWDDSLEEIRREKEIADANRELKSKFRANVEKQKNRSRQTVPISKLKQKEILTEAPPLPTGTPSAQKSEIVELEDFLDDLLG